MNPPQSIQPIDDADFDWSRPETVSVCCFLSDGVLIMINTPNGCRIPTGEVNAGEDLLLDALLRIPLEQAGFRRQGTHLVAASADQRHAVFWMDGSRYFGAREHADVDWWTGTADQATRLLRDQGDVDLAQVVELADDHRRNITDRQIAEDSRRLLDRAYLQANTTEGGSGFGGSAADWRASREQLCDAIDHDQTFLDIGCANGLLMESVVAWSAERGHRVEPYGVDHSTGLVELARRRLPQWADRIWVGDTLSWQHPHGRRFDTVAVLTDIVLPRRHPQLIKHLLDQVVAPGGRLLLSGYSGGEDLVGAHVLRRNGYPVDGETSLPARGRPDDHRSAWVINRSAG